MTNEAILKFANVEPTIADSLFPIDSELVDDLVEGFGDFESTKQRREIIQEKFIKPDEVLDGLIDFLADHWNIDPLMREYYREGFAITQVLIRGQANNIGLQIPQVEAAQVDDYLIELDEFEGTREDWMDLRIDEYDDLEDNHDGGFAFTRYVERCIDLSGYEDEDKVDALYEGSLDAYDFANHYLSYCSYSLATIDHRRC